MNYDFLQNYNIPARQNSENQYNNSTMEGAYGTYSMQSSQNIPEVNPAYYGYGGHNTYNSNYQYGATPAGNSCDYQNPERFMPPSKHGTSYTPNKASFKRKSNVAAGGGISKKQHVFAEVTSDGKQVIFLGRDESYPDELNSLIHPLSCDLCNVKMNSRAIAKDHYESKAHDKHLSTWLFKNYTEKNIEPPTIKRFVKQGSTGPDAYYCEACDLKLTSLNHANQHYAGKKHRSVISQRTKPSGAGFYNSEGKWVRTGTKISPNSSKDRYFGIGESFRLAEILNSTGNQNDAVKVAPSEKDVTTSIADTTTTLESEAKLSSVKLNKQPLLYNSEQDPALFCSICKVSVTSAVQMTMHLAGSKHTKKLKLAGINPTPQTSSTELQSDVISPATIMDNVLFSAIKEEIKPDPTDLSVYRTPSGQYYCKSCNISMSHLPGLEQHLMGKRHLRKLAEEKAMASLANKKN